MLNLSAELLIFPVVYIYDKDLWAHWWSAYFQEMQVSILTAQSTPKATRVTEI